MTMIKLQAKGLRWLKTIHLIAVACWIGGAVSLLMLYFLKKSVIDDGVLYGINQASHQVDMFVVVIPGAFGCLLTGLTYSLLSNWGFFKQRWLLVKWLITVTAILFGTFYLGPWETKMMDISGRLGMAALQDPDYLYNQRMNFMFGIGQCAVLLVTVWISVFKPWRKRKSGTKPNQ